ncbi:MAG: nicotinate (nicotinamide) nucleotide adenylyltransferase [Rikenellaceae bacterium]|jgi:nicotinate-nucleotide adenylyltransferase|nr:nicotinate (nicotinamide) nucleotide adenylyltransferase [Rikenellaceae bacterium]
MKNIALYFGSFNPIHTGHLAVVQTILDRGFADEARLVVSPHNPLKDVAGLAPETDRLEMAEIAVGNLGDPRVRVCDIEFTLPKPSYTFQTLDALRKTCPAENFSILMGEDSIVEFTKWKNFSTIADSTPIWVYARSGCNRRDWYRHPHVKPLEDVPDLDVSATQIRGWLAAGSPEAVKWLPAGVFEYIREKGLYRPSAADHIACGKRHCQHGDFGPALNDFSQALALDPGNAKALAYIEMLNEILAFRHKDIYNP